MSPVRLAVGLDYRPALVNREGIGRYVRGLARGFGQLLAAPCELEEASAALRERLVLRLFGWTLAASRCEEHEAARSGGRVELARLRVPARALGALRGLGLGVDDVPRRLGGLGRVALFHHTQYRRVPVRSAREVVTLHDLCYLDDFAGGAGYVDERTARRMSAFARDAVRFAAAILVPTEFVAHELTRRLRVAPERVFVTPLGADHVPTTAQDPRGPQPAEPYALTVSRVDLRKNHVGALRAFEVLASSGRPLRWIVAGAPGWGHEAFARALEHTCAPVEWRRDVSETELRGLYDGAALCVSAAFEEGFGLTPLEAQRRDVPVVAADHPVAREVLGDSVLFADPRDPEALAARVDEARVPERARELRERGRARSATFTWKRSAEATLAAYARALAQPPASPGVALP